MRISGMVALWVALLASTGVAARPKPVISLPFVDKWVVNYDDNACHLQAHFGDAKDGVALKLTRYQPGDLFDLWLFGTPLRADSRDVDLTLDFGVSGGPVARRALSGSANAGKLPFLLVGSHRIDGLFQEGKANPIAVTAQQEAAATALTIGLRGKQYRLETARLDRPLAKLRECETDLVRYWGFDPEVQAKLSRPAIPRGDPGDWARSSDFPREALRNGRSGRVKFRLDVDETGTVTKCAVLEQTNPTEFAKTSCEILIKRGKFEPALDQEGKPVRSFWVSSIVWMAW